MTDEDDMEISVKIIQILSNCETNITEDISHSTDATFELI